MAFVATPIYHVLRRDKSASLRFKMNPELERWTRNFAESEYFYGHDPGPVSRRAVRYHRPLVRKNQTANALDVGCGEGQDLLFLAQQDYDATGLDFTQTGIAKARAIVEDNGQRANLVQADILDWTSDAQFDLVLAVNCLQFLGSDAPRALNRVKELVKPGGVIGLSMFARDDAATPPVDETIYRWTLDELQLNFSGWQPLEAARLWQWNGESPQPFVTLIARAPF